ncbi:MAG TPA: hypothetical protein VFC78_22670, partial [Tepidisphaeraceae bacterium]|nr:hypothetical protein [Tepidisphaeraceae bacterium]
ACAHGTAVAAIPCLLSTLSLGSLEPIRVNLPYPGRLWRLARADGGLVEELRFCQPQSTLHGRDARDTLMGLIPDIRDVVNG